MARLRRRTGLLIGLAALLGFCATALAQDAAPLVPQSAVAADGTITFGLRRVPPPAYASPEAKAAFAKLWQTRLEAYRSRPVDPAKAAAAALANLDAGIKADKGTALSMFAVDVQETTLGGVPVSIYTPRALPAKNRGRIALEFEIDSEGVMVADYAKIPVISVHYHLRPAKQAVEDIVAVYREILKTHKARQVAFFGTSGGCTFAVNTTLYLKELKLPYPAALGLMTCSGGSQPGDARVTNNGLDPLLSTAVTGQQPRVGAIPPDETTRPGSTALGSPIPSDFPPSFLLSGTRDMCLSQTVLLHRKLRHAGVEADLNVFEGMWHAFHGDPKLPESHDALQNFAEFLGKHLG
jgi:hypothetical protein